LTLPAQLIACSRHTPISNKFREEISTSITTYWQESLKP